MRILQALALFLGLLISGVCSAAWAVPLNALPPLNRPVIDQAQLLAAADVQRIEEQLYAWREQGLMQAAVVIVDSTDGVESFDYALKLARTWQLGDAKADNGLLLLIAVQDRRFYILTGSGLEGALPDVSVARVQRNHLVPAFRQGQFAAGIVQSLEALATQLQADPDVQAQMIAADKKAAGEGAAEQLMPYAMVIFFVCLMLARLLGAMLSGAVGAAAVGAVSYVGLGLGAVSLVFALFFFVAFMFFYGANRSSGGRPIIISSGGHYGGGFGGGRSYGGGGGGFSGGGAGGSW